MSEVQTHWRDEYAKVKNPSTYQVVPRIKCVSGLEFSAQAGEGKYSSPRSLRADGLYSKFEVGFPNRKVDEFMPYVEDESRPTETVYGYVPFHVIDAVISANGGQA